MIKKPTAFNAILLTLILSFIATASYAACVPHTPQVNGCSTYNAEAYIGAVDPIAGAQVADSIRIFKSQCDTHDQCYGKVGESKAECDTRFIGQLRTQCRDSYPGIWEAYKEFIENVQQSVTDAAKCGTRYVPKVCISWLGPYDCGATEALTCTINAQVSTFKWISISAADAVTTPMETRIIDDVKYQNCVNIIVPGYQAAINSDTAVTGYQDYQTKAYAQASELAQNCSAVPQTGNRTYQVTVENSNIFAGSDEQQVKRIFKLHSGVEATPAQINSGLVLREAFPVDPPVQTSACGSNGSGSLGQFGGAVGSVVGGGGNYRLAVCTPVFSSFIEDFNWQYTYIRQLNDLPLY